jgi:hypothetical protein
LHDLQHPYRPSQPANENLLGAVSQNKVSPGKPRGRVRPSVCGRRGPDIDSEFRSEDSETKQAVAATDRRSADRKKSGRKEAKVNDRKRSAMVRLPIGRRKL